MANIFDLLKLNIKEPVASTPGHNVDPDVDIEPVQKPGSDARRMAERKAEEAGRKWRKKAEADGEVQKEIGGPKEECLTSTRANTGSLRLTRG